MERIATINRDTKETKINMNLNIDGSGENHINTGVAKMVNRFAALHI